MLFQKSVDKIQVSLKSAKNNRYFTWRRFYIYDSISLKSSWNEKCFRKTVIEKIKTQFLCSITIFRKSHYLWYNVEKYCGAREITDDVAIWRIRVSHCISKATSTQVHEHSHASGHSQARTRARAHTVRYAILFFSTAAMVSWKNTILHYTYIAFLVINV